MAEIKFGEVKSATKVEIQNFTKIKQERSSGSGSLIAQSFYVEAQEVATNPEPDTYISCNTETDIEDNLKSFSCYYMHSGQFNDPFETQFISTFGNRKFVDKLPLKEFRYGDIDKDGDVDIALKLSDGGIYVFHQETAPKKTPKKTP